MSEKYKSFSERKGRKETKSIQLEDMDQDLRTGLWNVFYEIFGGETLPSTYVLGQHRHNQHLLYENIWSEFLKKPIDEHSSRLSTKNVKNIFSEQPWYEVFDLIEFSISFLHKSGDIFAERSFTNKCNQLLEQENSAYTIVNRRVTEITSQQEIETIKTAMTTPYEATNGHIKNALSLFSNRENPDYRNSIKESISAVESIAKEITGKEKSLSALTQELPLHLNFRNGLNELYNWTSKTGIRHADGGKSLNPNKATARFMLIICSAFVNYIIAGESKNAP